MKNILGRTALKFTMALGVTSSLALPMSASATFIGDTVACSQLGSTSTFSCSSPSAVVGAGSEFRVGSGPSRNHLDVDIDSHSITFTALQDLSLGHTIVRIGDLGWTDSLDTIAAVSLSDNVSGLTLSDVSFSADSITLDLRGTFWNRADFARIGVTTTHRVSEPGALSLIGLTLAAAGFARRRS